MQDILSKLTTIISILVIMAMMGAFVITWVFIGKFLVAYILTVLFGIYWHG